MLADVVALLVVRNAGSLAMRLLGLLHACVLALVAIWIVIIVDVDIDVVEDLNKFT